MKDVIGLALAGNFAKHLEQAGEAKDFVLIKTDDTDAPKGMFAFYVPNSTSFLSRYCIDNEKIIIPKGCKVQAEPELALECELSYKDELVLSIKPLYFMAFNDTSIREGINASKISQKKNFSTASKGFGDKKIPIDVFEKGYICDFYSIASFIRHKDSAEFENYGEVSKVSTYSYFYSKLLEWMIKTINSQQDFAVLENLSLMLKEAKYPKKALISIGATRYMPKYEHTFLTEGDELCIMLFNHDKYSENELKEMLARNADFSNFDEISALRQRVLFL